MQISLNARILTGIFSGMAMLATLVMIAGAYFGDHNEVYTRRVAWAGAIAAVIFLLSWFL
jgi:hypothetical protein